MVTVVRIKGIIVSTHRDAKFASRESGPFHCWDKSYLAGQKLFRLCEVPRGSPEGASPLAGSLGAAPPVTKGRAGGNQGRLTCQDYAGREVLTKFEAGLPGRVEQPGEDAPSEVGRETGHVGRRLHLPKLDHQVVPAAGAVAGYGGLVAVGPRVYVKIG